MIPLVGVCCLKSVFESSQKWRVANIGHDDREARAMIMQISIRCQL
jgi:hypothetical protein